MNNIKSIAEALREFRRTDRNNELNEEQKLENKIFMMENIVRFSKKELGELLDKQK